MISAVVVSHNEGYILDKCLESLFFCDEIIVVDLESTDNTREISEKYEAKYIYHKKVAVVEIIHTWIQDKTKHDWILITDPDEVCSSILAQEIIELLPKVSDKVGLIDIPMRYYFGKHLLKGTLWGRIQRRVYIINRNKFFFTDSVHRGRHLKEGYKSEIIKFKKDNFVHHYWMQNIKQLVSKHRRYLITEGVSRYNSGQKCNFGELITSPFREFYSSLIIKNGYKDGFIGIFLSLFWAWYETNAKLKLYTYQKNIDK